MSSYPHAININDPAIDTLAVEHIIGKNSNCKQCVAAIPTSENEFVSATGGALVLSNTINPHQQYLFDNQSNTQTHLVGQENGHLSLHTRCDAHINCIAITKNGLLLAAGQAASRTSPTGDSPVCIWDVSRQAAIRLLHGPQSGIKSMEFTDDGTFLAAVTEKDVLYIWDVQTGEQLYTKQQPQPIGAFCWGVSADYSTRRPSYKLFWVSGPQVWIGYFTFDLRSLHYALAETLIQVPATGFVRRYECATACLGSQDNKSEYLLLGTTTGEIAVFCVATANFRAVFPISSNGVGAMTRMQSNSMVVCGCGDGTVRVVQGFDTKWECLAACQLHGAVQAVSVYSSPETEDVLTCIAATAAGRVYRVQHESPAPLTINTKLVAQELESSHLGPVSTISFGNSHSDKFATGSLDGRVRVWDLNNYSVLQSSRGPSGTAVLSVAVDDYVQADTGAYVLSAWNDGRIRYFESGSGRELWSIVAHKGKAISVAISPVAFLSAGDDGRVAVYARSTHELVLSFQDHSRSAIAVLSDIVFPTERLHSIGSDRCVFTYDISLERHIACHQLERTQAAPFTAITQKKHGEHELICATADGRLIGWDTDMPHVPAFEIPSGIHISASTNAAITCLQVSPSGRFLAAGGNDATLRLYRLVDGHTGGYLIATACGHTDTIRSLSWSADEKQLISGGDDNAIVIYNFYGTLED